MSATPNKLDVRTIRALQRLIEADVLLVTWAEEWAEGFNATSPTSGAGLGVSGGVSRPTEAAVVAPDDTSRLDNETRVWAKREGQGLADRAMALHNAIGAATKLVLDLAAEMRQLEPLAPETARSKARADEPREWGAGPCTVCDEWVPGVDENRLKSGMCPKHHRAWLRARERAPGLDRVAWIRTERANALVATSGDNEGAGSDT